MITKSKFKIFFSSIMLFSLFFASTAGAVSIDELVKRKNQLQKQEEQSKAILKKKQQEANSLQGAIDSLSDDIAYTQNRIANTKEQIDLSNQILQNLSEQIIETQKQLDDLTSKLNMAYVNLYELSQTSSIELALQSKSMSELVSYTQYVESIQGQLQENIVKVQTSKADLDGKKATKEKEKSDLEALNSSLIVSKSNLDRKISQKNSLLEQTQGDQEKYAQILEKIKNEKSAVDSELRALLERSARNSTNIKTGGSGGYPYAGYGIDSMADPWRFLVRECTSYAAWKWNSWGYYWYNTQPGRGNAKYWPEIARTLGYSTGSSPAYRAIISWPWGTYGHVAIVEKVNSDGSIVISEYNAVPPFGGLYSERTIAPANYSGAVFIYAP